MQSANPERLNTRIGAQQLKGAHQTPDSGPGYLYVRGYLVEAAVIEPDFGLAICFNIIMLQLFGESKRNESETVLASLA